MEGGEDGQLLTHSGRPGQRCPSAPTACLAPLEDRGGAAGRAACTGPAVPPEGGTPCQADPCLHQAVRLHRRLRSQQLRRPVTADRVMHRSVRFTLLEGQSKKGGGVRVGGLTHQECKGVHYLCPRVHICSLSSTKYATHTHTHTSSSRSTPKKGRVSLKEAKGTTGTYRKVPSATDASPSSMWET